MRPDARLDPPSISGVVLGKRKRHADMCIWALTLSVAANALAIAALAGWRPFEILKLIGS